MAKKVTAKNVEKVLSNLQTFYVENVKDSKESAKAFANDLNEFLDQLASEDVFGTEGQLDPRGDQR